MRSSTAIPLLFAGLAIASPLMQAAKKDYVYDIVTDVVYVTVTDATTLVQEATAAPSSTIAGNQHVNNHPYAAGGLAPGQFGVSITSSTEIPTPTTLVAVPTSTSIAPVVEPSSTEVPTTSVAPVIPVVTVTIQPSSTEVEVPSTSSVAVVPTTSAAPVVVAQPSSTVAAPSSAVATNDASAASSTDLVTASLYHHNIHRANHSAPEATWDTKLASYAATVAASCVYAHDLTPGGGGYGQNIATFGETGDVQGLGEAHMVAQASTDMWYNGEVNSFLPSYYGQDNPDFSNFDSWGHFSQMVWKSSTTIGCASQFCNAGTIFSGFGSWFTVCNYGPEGNMGGEYGANVLEPLGHETVTAPL